MARSNVLPAIRTGKSAAAPKPGLAGGAGTFPDLDRTIHERMRLGIVSALAANRSLTFGELKAILKTTDGNLSIHSRRLEEAGYVECTKSFSGRVPKTEFRLTPAGKKALDRYLCHMEAIVRAMRAPA